MLQQITYKRADGSFVGVVNGLPYHIEVGSSYYDEAAAMAAISTPPDEPPHPSLSAVEQRQVDELKVRQEAARRIEALGAEYTKAERETWSQQTYEAISYQANPAASVPMLTGIAAGKGLTVSEMVTRVLTKVAEFGPASGAILGKQAELLAMDPIPADFDDDGYWS